MSKNDCLKYIESNIVDIDCGYRGGKLSINASELFDYIDNPIIGAYQNYLGGGMLGAVVGGASFEPSELKTKKDRKVFDKMLDACKRYLHNQTNHVDDEWENASFEANQNRAISAY